MMSSDELVTQAIYDTRAGCRATGGALAYALSYPHDCFLERLREAVERARVETPAAVEPLVAFIAAVEPLSVEQREELYTRTFDINPVCSLEIGWQLFGEEYHRGALLVRLRSELRRHGIEESTELPDHLTHVLSLLDRMDEHEARSFANCCVIPAVDKMLVAFEDQDNPYGRLLLAVGMYLKHRFVGSSTGGAS
ncbi:MAG: nitrate reductase molybdenum cofactor assembly chaperone [Pirellulaceae bacterium]